MIINYNFFSNIINCSILWCILIKYNFSCCLCNRCCCRIQDYWRCTVICSCYANFYYISSCFISHWLILCPTCIFIRPFRIHFISNPILHLISIFHSCNRNAIFLFNKFLIFSVIFKICIKLC